MSRYSASDDGTTDDADSRSSADMNECDSSRSSSLSLTDTNSSASEMGSSKPFKESSDSWQFKAQEKDGTMYPRTRFRSLSVPALPHRHVMNDVTTMTEEINGLKSFLQVWDNKQRKTEPVFNSNSCERQERASEPAPNDDDFEFPFYHLNPADLEMQERESKSTPNDDSFEFPFFHLNSTDLEWQPPFLDKSLSKLMQMVGLDEVKKEFVAIQEQVKAFQYLEEKLDREEGSSREKKPSARSLKLDLIVSGSSGTGKSAIAELYKKFLEDLGISKSFLAVHKFNQGSDWDSETDDCKECLFIVDDNEELVKKMLADPKARERCSRRFHLKDYFEDDLLLILVKLLKEYSLKVEGGYRAPFLRTVIRRLKQRKGKEFHNANTLQAEIKKACRRQAERLGIATSKETVVTRISIASYRLLESDFLEAKPENFYERSEFWKKLDKMAGMEKIKETVRELVTRKHINDAREAEGEEPLQTTLNYVFLGPPGTGKTTAAMLFGQIIAELGYVEDSKAVIKKPTDFLGKYVGFSESKTQEILDNTKGKVLIIDEAHMFYHGTEHGTDGSDIFRKGIIDTIVQNVDNEPGSNRCIILMGYPDRMREFYRNTNPGFERRFPLDTAFEFENYDDKALGEIMDIMLSKDGIKATDEAKHVAMEVLRRERDRPNFGNGGAVRNLIGRAQVLYSKRIAAKAKENPNPGKDSLLQGSEARNIVLQPQDFDPKYDRGVRADTDFRSLFKDLVGFQDIIRTFEGYQKMTANMEKRGLDPREEVPFSFVFKGPPGTGKTTTAKALGQIYHSMGFLSTTEVMDCSVTDLVASNGLTGRKVQSLLERGLGKVLFIDEAYRMGQRDLTGAFISRLAQEAVGELVDCMTKEKFAGKLVIVLAGYEKDMDGLMSTNEGLRGRFTQMVFPNMRPKNCLRLLQRKLEHKKIEIVHLGGKQEYDKVVRLFDRLSKTEAWANARDVESIAKRIKSMVFMKEIPESGALDVTLGEIAVVLKKLYQERRPQKDGGEES